MVSIILIVLFICQLLSFFLIMILNSKLAKFKDLEARQEKIIREMDDAIGAYLMEMKEENDRLIQELATTKQVHTVVEEIPHDVQQRSNTKQAVNEATIDEPLHVKEPSSVELTREQTAQPVKSKPFVPINVATNAYNKQREQTNLEAESELAELIGGTVNALVEENTTPELTPFERQVVKMYNEGKSVEDIAKETQKGKTEIELLIKFHG